MTDPVVLRRDRDVLAVRGPDAEAYLQGQLSQDVAALAEGDSAWTFVLQPAGKVDAWLRITCRSAGHFLLDVDGGYGGALLDRLRRFLLRTDCTVEPLDWQAVTLWGTTEGEAATDDWEPLRLAAGIPAMGSEIDGDTIPGATGLVGRSTSFTKGCYTGQELVARVDSRAAGTPTHLVRVRGEGARPAVRLSCTSPRSDPRNPRLSVAGGWVASARGHLPRPDPRCAPRRGRRGLPPAGGGPRSGTRRGTRPRLRRRDRRSSRG